MSAIDYASIDEQLADDASRERLFSTLQEHTEQQLAILSGICADMRKVCGTLAIVHGSALCPHKAQYWLAQRDSWRGRGEQISAEFARRAS